MVKVAQKIMSLLPPHKNVIQILGQSKCPQGNIVLVMPFYSIGCLMDHLYGRHKERSQHIKFDLIRKVYLIYDICVGLRHLHINGIMHLDVAARNVLLFEEKDHVHACLSDFSMAKFEEDIKSNMEVIQGPLKWMAPEFLKCGIRTKKCDIFSLAITA